MSYKAYGVSVKDGEKYVNILFPLINTETGNYESKLHLGIPHEDKVFCGSKKKLFVQNAGDLEWVTQADPANELCQRCKKAAILYLNKISEKSDQGFLKIDEKFSSVDAHMVIGHNERTILQAASEKIDDPNHTTVGMISLAKREVTNFTYNRSLIGLSESDFLRHKQNLLSEMDEAIKAATL